MARQGTPAASAAGGATQLGARWFVGNARREGRLRAGRLSQVGLRQAVGRRDRRVARQGDGVARDTGGALVRGVGMRAGGVRATIVVGMRCGIVMMRRMPMRRSLRGMTCMRFHHRRVRGSLRYSAERHRRRRIPLEGYGEHHQPQQEHANTGHPVILGGRAARISSGHWITLSARFNTERGIVKPSRFAVLRLISSSNFVGCSIGRSAGLAPFSIRST